MHQCCSFLQFPCGDECNDDDDDNEYMERDDDNDDEDDVAFGKEANIDSLSSLAKNEEGRRQHICTTISLAIYLFKF